MYILLTNNIATEIIPDENPIFPGVSIHERYAPDFVEKLVHVSDDIQVKQNWIYNLETQTFSEPNPSKEQNPQLTEVTA